MRRKGEDRRKKYTWNKTMWFGVDAISDYDWVVAVQMRCLDDKQPLNKYIHVNYLRLWILPIDIYSRGPKKLVLVFLALVLNSFLLFLTPPSKRGALSSDSVRLDFVTDGITNSSELRCPSLKLNKSLRGFLGRVSFGLDSSRL